MTKFKYCATGFVALAAMIGSATVQADDLVTWFEEDATSVESALQNSGETDYGTWSAGDGTLSEALSVDSDSNLICVDTDGENRLAYTPKVAMSGNTATVTLTDISFTAPVNIDDSQLEGVQAAVAIVDDENSGELRFVVANNGIWEIVEDGFPVSAEDTYTITCTFDYDAGEVTYAMPGGDWTVDLPDCCERVSTTEFEGTCSFASLSGEKEGASGITITIEKGEGVADVLDEEGNSVVGELVLPADEGLVTLELAGDALNIPLFKVIQNGVTNVMPKVASYEIEDGDKLVFIADEAEYDDPTVTDDDIKQAIKDSFEEEVAEDAAEKVEAIVGTDDNQVSAKALATWLSDNMILSDDFVNCDYVVASVKFNTDSPITDDNTEVEFTEVEMSADGFVFAFELYVDEHSMFSELVEGTEDFIASCIQTTDDLGEGFLDTVDPDRVSIDFDAGTVTVEPDPENAAEFFQIAIPQDPSL